VGCGITSALLFRPVLLDQFRAFSMKVSLSGQVSRIGNQFSPRRILLMGVAQVDHRAEYIQFGT